MNLTRLLGKYFGGDEKLLACDSAALNPLLEHVTDVLFILVIVSSVDEAITGL